MSNVSLNNLNSQLANSNLKMINKIYSELSRRDPKKSLIIIIKLAK